MFSNGFIDKKTFLYACGTLFIYPQYDLMSDDMELNDYAKVRNLQYSYLVLMITFMLSIMFSLFISNWLVYIIMPLFMLLALLPCSVALLYRYTNIFNDKSNKGD